MAFREVSSLDAEVTIAIGKKDKQGKPYPKQAEGYYLGSRSVESKRGQSVLHFLQTPKGNLGVWGTTDLNRKLGQATAGTMVRITSTGTKPTPNGDMYTYRVECDPDNTIEVESLVAGSSTVVEENNDAYDTDADTTDDSDVDDDIAQQAALAAAERKAKVQAVLNKNKR
jgi:hypothetical protein